MMDILALAERWLRDLEESTSPDEARLIALKTIAASLVVLAKEAEAGRRNVSISNTRPKR